jgi:hypothetical protein
VTNRNHLAWICATSRVERLAESVLVCQVVGGEHLIHIRLLLNTDAVLTRENAASVQRDPHDLGASRMYPVEDAIFAAIEHE